MLMGPISLSLIILSVYLIQPKVEAKLTSNVQSILRQNNISVDVSFSGRDGILKGEVENKEISDNAERLSLSVFGTRVIRNQLIIKTPPSETQIISNNAANIKITTALHTSKNIKDQVKRKKHLIVAKKQNNELSDIDKIIANMQKTALIKPKKIPAQRVVEKRSNNSNIKNNQTPISNKKGSEIILAKQQEYQSPILIEDKKETDILINKQQENKAPKIVIAVANNQNISKPATLISSKKENRRKKNHDPLLDIIDDFNAALTPKRKQHIKNSENVKNTAKQLKNIDLSAIKFLENSSKLKSSSYPILNQIKDSINTYHYASINIVLYANDSDLAYARGVAIRNYLAKKGINTSNIEISGRTINAATKLLVPITIKINN